MASLSPYEWIIIADLASTVALELVAEMRKEGQEMTLEQFQEVSGAIKKRREDAMALIRAH